MSAAEAAKQAARLTDPVEHGLGMAGMLAGLVLGAVVGALIVAATVATGGGALAIAIAAVGAVGATAGGGLAMGQLVHGISTLLGFSGIVTGAIIPATSPDVRIGNLFAARAKLDGAICSGLMHHAALPKALIATGSSGVFINRMPAARQGDKLVCGADIKQGFPTVLIGGGTVQVLPIDDAEANLRNILGAVALASLVGVGLLLGGGFLAGAICGTAVLNAVAVGFLFFAGNELLGVAGDHLGPGWRDALQGGFGVAALVGGGYKSMRSIETGRPLLGEPVDGVTGEVCMVKSDFLLPGALPLELKRAYASGLDHGSCFGPKWCSTWGQYVEDAGTVALWQTADGRSLGFELLDAEPAAWLKTPLVDKVRLRRAPVGYEVRDQQRRTLRFSERLGVRWLLTSIEDPNGYSIRFTYDRNGALREVNHSGGYRLHIEGTASQIRRVVLDGGTELIRYEYDSGGRLSAVIDGSELPFRYEYDEAARITRWQDRSVTYYEYRYDEAGRCIEAVGPDGMYHYRFSYNEAQRSVQAADSLGGITTLIHNQRLQVVQKIDARDNVTATEWDERSNKLSETDPMGRTTAYSYDAEGNLVTAKDPLGRTTRILYNDAGMPALLTDTAGKNWLRRYDERGNLIEAGLENGAVWKYERDGQGNLVRIVDPGGRSRHFAYDARGLPVLETDWEANIATYQRDALGRVVEAKDRLSRVTQFGYNGLGKLADVTLAAGSAAAKTLHWEYDAEGNLVRRVQADGRAYTYAYGAFDLLHEVTKPSGGRLRLSYDTEARLVTVENERGELYRYTRDAGGQVTQEDDFAGRRQQYRYDASGLLNTKINGNGERIRYERDSAGQLLRKTSADGETEFAYDAYGRITKAVNPSLAVLFERDEYGRVVRETQGGRSVESRYDERGLRVGRQISDGSEIKWTHDGNGQVTGLQLPGDELLAFVRDANGRETERRLRGGLVMKQEFDPLDRLVNQWAGLEATGSSTVSAIAGRQYLYDENDNPVEIRDAKWGNARYAYNPDGRIAKTDKDRGTNEEFTYDLAGNIAATTILLRGATAELKLRYYARGGRLEKIGETDYHYDADCRVTEKREGGKRWRYEWTVEGQLRSVITPKGERWTYHYDALGRRVSKRGPSGKTEYLWDGGTVAEEITSGRTATWVYEPGTFRPVAKQENGKTYACVTDQVGTPRELVSGSGEVGWSAQFSTWGELEHETNSKTDCPIRFQGQWFDDESGLAYNWNRYYEPGTGNYLSSDPIGLDGGTRSFGYVHNPLSWVDPFGLQPDPPPTVWRVIRHDEDPSAGLFAKNPDATYTVEGHVLNGSRPGFSSQYISTTADPSVAQQWASKTGNRIVEVDLSKVDNPVIDLSNPEGRAASLKGVTSRNFAGKSSEVLIEKSIPADAINSVSDPPPLKCG